MGLREGQKQQREEENLMDAKTSVWMGLREGDAAEGSRKGRRDNRDKQ